jgi:hypothetical protein
MLLKKEDAELFYDLYFKVLQSFFHSLAANTPKKRNFDELALDELVELRDKLFSDVRYLNKYCSENPDNISADNIEIVRRWKFFIKKTFIIYKDLKNYTLFVDTQESKSYGVCGLMTEIRDIMGNKFPVMADALLLSYKDSIVIDGMLTPYEMKISGALGKILLNSYRDSKAEQGVITQLPPIGKNKNQNDKEMLEYFLSMNKEGKAYTEEILNLIKQNFLLLRQYYDGVVKPNKEIYAVLFKTLGLKKGWFGMLEGIIITSGRSEAEVITKLQEFLPPEKIELTTIFEINGD